MDLSVFLKSMVPLFTIITRDYSAYGNVHVRDQIQVLDPLVTVIIFYCAPNDVRDYLHTESQTDTGSEELARYAFVNIRTEHRH